MTNNQQIRQRLSEMEEAVTFLKQTPNQEFDTRDKFLLGRYYLQIALEALLNIGNQIIANEDLRKPANYREIIEILKESGILPLGAAKQIMPFVDLRNRLVHAYWKIPKDEFLKIIKECLPILETFTGLILKYIKNNP